MDFVSDQGKDGWSFNKKKARPSTCTLYSLDKQMFRWFSEVIWLGQGLQPREAED